MDCVIRALDKIHQLIQGKTVGFTLLWPILSSYLRPSPELAGLNLDLGHKVRPQFGHRPTLDLGQSLSLDFNNKIR